MARRRPADAVVAYDELVASAQVAFVESQARMPRGGETSEATSRSQRDFLLFRQRSTRPRTCGPEHAPGVTL